MEELRVFDETIEEKDESLIKDDYTMYSMIQIWGRWLGYPCNPKCIEVIETFWRAIFSSSYDNLRIFSDDDFNTVISRVIRVLEREYGAYRSMIFDTVKNYEDKIWSK